jgi:Plasmid recombination enzyme
MAASHVLRMAKLKGSGKILAASRHNKRVIQAEKGADSHIDTSRSHLNYSLVGIDNPEAIADQAKSLISEAGIVNLRKDAVMAIEVIFSLPSNTSIDVLGFFIDCCDWLPIHLGGEVLSFDVHLDEACPHAHALVLPLVDNRMIGGKLLGFRGRLRSLQDSFHMLVGRNYGLTKPMRKLSGEAKTKTANIVLDFLKTDPIMKSSIYQLIRDDIVKNPEKYADYLNIEKATPNRKTKDFVSIMISKGRGT